MHVSGRYIIIVETELDEVNRREKEIHDEGLVYRQRIYCCVEKGWSLSYDRSMTRSRDLHFWLQTTKK